MLHARLTVDLPSVETLRRMSPIEWLQALFGKHFDLHSGEEDLTIGALALVQALYNACRKIGVTNAIALLVDKKVLYADAREVENDLALILRAAERSRLLRQRFKEMRLALEHRERGLHTIIDIKIQSHVRRGEAEMEMILSSRLEHLRIAAGETAAAYAARIRAFGQAPEAAEEYRQRLETLQERLAAALRAALPGAVIHLTPAQMRLTWPEARQIGRFRRLRFGADVCKSGYRPVLTRQQRGVYSDPYYHYYYDPYDDLTNWLLLDTLLHQRTWPSPHWHIVPSDGSDAYVPDNTAHVASAWTSAAVYFDDMGNLQVDEAIPDLRDAAETVEQQSAWGGADLVGSERFAGTDLRETAWGGSDIGHATSSYGSSESPSCDSSDSSSCDASDSSSC
jgi:hypothetical protein